MEPTKKRIVRGIARRLALRVFLVAALLSASVAVYSQGTGYWYGTLSDGSNAFLWCGTSAGNFWTKCPVCPAGQSCSCDVCDTGPCQDTADEQCALHGRD
jgi:hypothetical protein